MHKNIETEIHRLLKIKEEVDGFNSLRKVIVNLVPISKARYDELAHDNQLDESTLYYILSKEVGQYIEGYQDI